MVLAWYLDVFSQGSKNEQIPGRSQLIPVDELYSLSKIEHFKVNVDELEKDETYWELRKKRGYNYEDVLEISPDKLHDYDAKVKIFKTEHLHKEEEVRLVLEGRGFFDFRDLTDKWVRIEVGKGDLLVLPAGIYHGFTTDQNNYIKLQRLFCNDSTWKAYFRATADIPDSQKYKEGLSAVSGQSIPIN